MYTKRSNRGFTLIELLVVIAIIGTLASVVLASLNSARANARDAKRAADIKQLQLALEFYYDENNRYPVDGSGTRVSEIASALTPDFLPTIPTDPTNTGSAGYRYYATSAGDAYTMLVQLEGDSTTWCSVRTNNSPGWSSPTSYPPCEF